jgi:hypothetical protein
VCFSETLVSTYETTRRHNPEEQALDPHRRENLKSHNPLHLNIIQCSLTGYHFSPEDAESIFLRKDGI